MANQMTGPQKAAIFLLAMGEEAAGNVLQNLTEAEIRQLAHFMSEIDDVNPQDVDRVANEFFLVAERKNFVPGPPQTKTGFLRSILNRALGDEKSNHLMEGMLASDADSPLEQLKWHAPSTIAKFLQDEHPQVIATILANMGDPRIATEVISNLPEDMQQDVYQRLARYRAISQDLLEEIEGSLREEMQPPPPRQPEESPGPDKVAEVLTTVPEPMESKLMHHIEQRNPELADQIRDQMFPFEDFIKIDNFGIQKILQESNNDDLVLALKSASEPLQRHFFRNMATDSAEVVQKAMGVLGSTRISEIEGAQKRLAAIASRLNDQGELMVLGRKS